MGGRRWGGGRGVGWSHTAVHMATGVASDAMRKKKDGYVLSPIGIGPCAATFKRGSA